VVLRTPKAWLVALLLTSSVLCAAGLGRVSLWNNNEPRYAHTARNMIATGDWVNPTYKGKLRTDKPPLTYWLIALSAEAFNHGKVNEFSARLPFAILGVTGVWFTYLLGTMLYGEAGGVLSGLFLLLTLEYLITARRCLPDMALTVFVLLTILLLLKGYQASSRKTLCYAVASIPAALGFLTKGPIALVLPAGAMGVFLVFKGELRLPRLSHLLPGALLFVILVAPWFFAVDRRFLADFFLVQNLQRFSNGFDHHKPWFFYLQCLPWNFAPASYFLPLGIWGVVKEKRESPLLLPLCWFIFTFLLISLAASKRVIYLLPAAPALALVAGGMVSRVVEASQDTRATALFHLGLGATLVSLGISVFLPMIFHLNTEPWFYLTALIPLALLALQRIVPATLQSALTALLVITAYSLYFLVFQPAYDRSHRSAKPLAKAVATTVKNAPLYKMGFFDAALEYYLGRYRVPEISDTEELAMVSLSQNRFFLLLREKDWRRMTPLFESDFQPVLEKESRGKGFVLLVKTPHRQLIGSSSKSPFLEKASKLQCLATHEGAKEWIP